MTDNPLLIMSSVSSHDTPLLWPVMCVIHGLLHRLPVTLTHVNEFLKFLVEVLLRN